MIKGSFFYCDLPSDIVDTEIDCYDQGGNWINADYNFDNILNAAVTLFVISTTEGWTDLMYYGIDSRGIGLNPKRDSRQYFSIFYILFVIVGSFFIINLFTGVIVDAFRTEKDKITGFYYLNYDEQQMVTIKLKIYKENPVEMIHIPKIEKRRRYVNRSVSSAKFEWFIIVVIMLNAMVFLIQYNRSPKIIEDISFYANLVFLVIFLIEAILKIYVEQVKYFSNGWNQFDFLVLLLSIVTLVLDRLHILSIGTATSALRSFRIFRVLRLVKRAKSLRIMFQTIIHTLPDLANIGGLILLVLFIFSALGFNLYPYIKHSQDGFHEDSNFSTILTTFFTLFKSATGEEWNFLQADATRLIQPNNVCFDLATYEDYAKHGMNSCGTFTGYLFFIAFQIFFSMIMLNLLVAVIIEGFQKIIYEENAYINTTDFEIFVNIWKEFDREATGFIKASYFTSLMVMLPQPLGWKSLSRTISQKRLDTMSYQLPIYIINKGSDHGFFFYDILHILSEDYLYLKYGISEADLVGKRQIERMFAVHQKRIIQKIQKVVSTEYSSADWMATSMLQKAWLKRKKMLKLTQNYHDNMDVSSSDSSSESGTSKQQQLQQQQQNQQKKQVSSAKTLMRKQTNQSGTSTVQFQI